MPKFFFEDHVTKFINRLHRDERRTYRASLKKLFGGQWQEEFKKKWEEKKSASVS